MVYLFSSRLKSLRQSRDLHQDQLASLIDVDRTTISSYESDMRQPSLATLLRIADVFGVSTDYLLGRTDRHEAFDLDSDEKMMLYRMAYTLSEKNRQIRQLKEREANVRRISDGF